LATSVPPSAKLFNKPIFVNPLPLKPLKCSIIPLTKDEKALKRSITLLEHYFKEWKSVKYRLGGLSKKGIDCSGFVHLTFLNQFNVTLPRNTYSQVKRGKTIAKHELKTGDLVFFKTKPRVNHVGIYLQDNQFIHASSSKGIMKSSLNNAYWAKRYWTAKRINFETTDFLNEVIRLGQV
jgi:hypothetical protein